MVGGYLGIVTALVAWYASAAGVMNGQKGREVFPVGKPLHALQELTMDRRSRTGPARLSVPLGGGNTEIS